MADRYVFSDEAGNFDFSRGSGASRYFILGTVTADDCRIGDELLQLRRDLGWRGIHLDKVFHATEDPQAVRDEVFQILSRGSFRIDATILEKSKAQPHLQEQRALYKMAWFLHFKHVAPAVANEADRLFVIASSLGTKRKRATFHGAVDEVVAQVSPCVPLTGSRSGPPRAIPASRWSIIASAIQRKWEREDQRSYDLIKDKISSEFDGWSVGPTHYY